MNVIESHTGRAGLLVEYKPLVTPKRRIIPGATVRFVKGGTGWECWYPLSSLIVI